MLKVNKIFKQLNLPSSVSKIFIGPKTPISSFHLTQYPLSLTNRINAYFSSTTSFDDEESVKFYFVEKNNKEIPVEARTGENLLEIAQRYGIRLEGICEQTACCSTCHVILDEEIYDNLPMPRQDEEDLLDRTTELTRTSRLGCQVAVTKEFDGSKVRLPRRHVNLWALGDES